jgi:hypothetical protein
LSFPHSTQWSPRQTGVGAAQLSLLMHCTQRFRSSQSGVVPPQLVFARHWTQSPLAALQSGALGSVQSVLTAQWKWQRLSPPHAWDGGQLASTRHSTHAPSRTLQMGAAVGQSLLVAHSEH